jgi:hypothetical protein
VAVESHPGSPVTAKTTVAAATATR